MITTSGRSSRRTISHVSRRETWEIALLGYGVLSIIAAVMGKTEGKKEHTRSGISSGAGSDGIFFIHHVVVNA